MEGSLRKEGEDLQTTLKITKEKRTFDQADQEFKKDVTVKFSYYLAFAEVIRVARCANPTRDILTLVTEYQAFVGDNPPNPSMWLEIGDLADLGVDLSFFPDPTQLRSRGVLVRQPRWLDRGECRGTTHR